jgi:hypothetical protein
MIIKVDGKDIKLNDKDAAIARGIVKNFLNCMKAGAAKANRPQLYFTILIALYDKSAELLTAFGFEALEMLMDVADSKNAETKHTNTEALIQNLEYIIPEVKNEKPSTPTQTRP